MPGIGVKQGEKNPDEHEHGDRDGDVDDHLLDEGHHRRAGIQATAEDERLQDSRDEVDDDDGEDWGEVETAEGGEDAPERSEDGVDNAAQPAHHRMPRAEADP